MVVVLGWNRSAIRDAAWRVVLYEARRLRRRLRYRSSHQVQSSVLTINRYPRRTHAGCSRVSTWTIYRVYSTVLGVAKSDTLLCSAVRRFLGVWPVGGSGTTGRRTSRPEILHVGFVRRRPSDIVFFLGFLRRCSALENEHRLCRVRI